MSKADGNSLVGLPDVVKDTADATDTNKLKAIVNLNGEAALRLEMWARSMHLHPNVAAKQLLLESMVKKGLLTGNYRNYV